MNYRGGGSLFYRIQDISDERVRRSTTVGLVEGDSEGEFEGELLGLSEGLWVGDPSFFGARMRKIEH